MNLLLALGVVAVSAAAPVISVLQIPAVAIAAWRLLGASLLYGIAGRGFIQLWRHRNDWRLTLRCLSAGLALCLHFLAWITAFDYTDLSSAVLILVSQPIFAALLGRFFFAERFTRGMIWAMMLAVPGLTLIVADDLAWSQRALIGDLLCLFACGAIAVFYALAKPLHRQLAFPAYMTATYGSAGVMTLMLALVLKTPLTGFSNESWGLLLILIFVPTAIGHALMNYVVKTLRLFTVNLAILGEPIGAIALAAIWLGTSVSPVEIAGGILLGASLIAGFSDQTRILSET